MDRTQHVHGALARNGEPIRVDAEAAHVAAARLDRRLAHVRPARDNRGRAQLGLSVYMDSRFVLHALRTDAPGLYTRGRGVHALDDGSLRRARAGWLAPDHVQDRRTSRAARGGAPPV